jgi:hypothetical protein
VFKITHYFEWQGEPAVVGETSDTTSGGYYLVDNKWKRAMAITILELFNVADQLSKQEFESMFGVIGKDILALPAFD